MNKNQAAIRLIAIAALSATALPLPWTSQAQAQTVIGAAAPLTGPRALLGRNYKQGVELALEEINAAGGVLGKPLQITFEDDQGDNPNAALNAVTKLMQVSKAPVILGPHFSVAQLATQKTYCTGATVSITGATGIPVTATGCKFVIRIRGNDNIQARALVEYARKEIKTDKIGIIAINDDMGRGGLSRITAVLEAAGLKPVAVESHNAGDKDFSAQLAKMKNAGAALVLMWTHDNEAGLIVRQARQLGLEMKFGGSTSASEPTFIRLAGAASEGVISANDFVASNPAPHVQAFVKKYEAKYGSLPEIWAATYYDAAHFAARAINAAGSTDPEKVRAAFDKVKYDGVLATYACQENGDCNHQINIVEIKDGQPVVRSTVKF
jgi:branched-chain amino acid transport system substrate-binding protein